MPFCDLTNLPKYYIIGHFMPLIEIYINCVKQKGALQRWTAPQLM